MKTVNLLKKHGLIWICMQRTGTKVYDCKKNSWLFRYSKQMFNKHVAFALATLMFTTLMILTSNMQRVEKDFRLEQVILFSDHLLCSLPLWSSLVTCTGWKRTSDWNRWSFALTNLIFTSQMILHFSLEPVILCSDHLFICLPNDPH